MRDHLYTHCVLHRQSLRLRQLDAIFYEIPAEQQNIDCLTLSSEMQWSMLIARHFNMTVFNVVLL